MKSDRAHFSAGMHACLLAGCGRVGLVEDLAHPAVSCRCAEVKQVALAQAAVVETARPVLGRDLFVEARILLAGVVVIVNVQFVNLGFRAIRSELAHVVFDVLLQLDKRLGRVDFNLKVEHVVFFKLNTHHQHQTAVISPVQVGCLVLLRLARIVVTELLLLSMAMLLLVVRVIVVAAPRLLLLTWLGLGARTWLLLEATVSFSH